MRKVMAFYPPGPVFQRGEDRCQANIEDSTSSSPRANNDLGYASSTLKALGYDVFIKDYQNERLPMSSLIQDFLRYSPDVIFLSTTNATIFYDLDVVNKLKLLKQEIVVVLKGAVFFNATQEMLSQLDLVDVDYMIGGESEFVLPRLMSAHFDTPQDIQGVSGIFYRNSGVFVSTGFEDWDTDLDSLPFPDREAMNNRIYVRPDTGEPMATIATSRGCPSSCVYCLTPIISGRKVRFRTPGNVFAEISECYTKYGIRDFFFKSDTFTIDKHWVMSLCELIEGSPLSGKIKWVANSRVNPIEQETLARMKRAGCWLVAFGFESGSEETLAKIRKGATLDDARRANQYAREAGLQVFGFYMIGFPWESADHLQMTRRFMFEMDADFVEMHIAIPFYGTHLYEMTFRQGLISGSLLGKDYFNPSIMGTKYLNSTELEAFRKKTLLAYHMRPKYVLRKISYAGLRSKLLLNYARYGLKLLRKTVT